jgi:DNA-directed RNA polymerase specialized sigma24 family protein
MRDDGSVTQWIAQVKAGNDVAAQELWQRYFWRLVQLCRKKLGEHPRRAMDEEDAALSALASFCQGVREDRFPQLRDRDNLWPLLVKIATRKAVDQIDHQHRKKRGGGQVRGESVFDGTPATDVPGIDGVIGDEPTPEFAAIVGEEYERLMQQLKGEMLRKVAELKLEGYTNQEIARQLGCSPRSVDRKLWVIRSRWSAKDEIDE